MNEPFTTELQLKWQRSQVLGGRWICCLNCENWKTVRTVDSTTEQATVTEWAGCSLANGQVPPPEVIMHGCKSWIDDIPF